MRLVSTAHVKIRDRFVISGRGVVIVTEGTSDLPIGTLLQATVLLPDGSRSSFRAGKEWLHRRQPKLEEIEAFLLLDAQIEQVPPGAKVTLNVPETK